ncbi:hypothetical protein COCOBI_11-4330 [Coccomyxa sp. Obi]|nr:hypothetical protein COCOBI_11-4330 [Coccomyxa sp. Obi]
MQPDSCPIFTLNDELLQLIAAQLELEDLCNLGRVSSYLNTVINNADNVWKELYIQSFGSPPSSASSSRREQFRDRAAEDSRKRKVLRQAHIMRVRSRVHILERDVRSCQQQIHTEQCRVNTFVAEKQQIEQARQVGAALQCWQPEIVKNHHEALFAQTPITDMWRARELDMGIKDHKLALKGLLRSLQVQSAQLGKQRMRLQALLGE